MKSNFITECLRSIHISEYEWLLKYSTWYRACMHAICISLITLVINIYLVPYVLKMKLRY